MIAEDSREEIDQGREVDRQSDEDILLLGEEMEEEALRRRQGIVPAKSRRRKIVCGIVTNGSEITLMLGDVKESLKKILIEIFTQVARKKIEGARKWKLVERVNKYRSQSQRSKANCQ